MSAGTFHGVQFHLFLNLFLIFRCVLCQFAERSKQIPHWKRALTALYKERDYFSVYLFCLVVWSFTSCLNLNVLCQFTEHSKQLPHSIQVLMALCKECDYFPVYLFVCLFDWMEHWTFCEWSIRICGWGSDLSKQCQQSFLPSWLFSKPQKAL